MAPKLDELLSQSKAAERPLDAVRAALQAELSQPRGPSWRKSLALAVGACWALMLAFGVVLVLAGAAEPAHLLARAPLIAGLAALTAFTAWLALAPLPRWAPLFGALAGVLGVAVLVVARGVGAASTTPEWVCTATHLGAGVLPLVVMLLALRRAAHYPLRALAAGFAVGTTGAEIGELACGRGWLHVLEYHATAWLLIAVLCLVIARRLKRVSYAP